MAPVSADDFGAIDFKSLKSGLSQTAGSDPTPAMESAYLIREGPCTVDYSVSPALKALAQTLADTCAEYFPQVHAIMRDPQERHPLLVLVNAPANDPKFVAVTTGETVRLGADHFAKRPDDLGCIVHELAHVEQSYPDHSPPPAWQWLKESIADVVRARVYPDASWRPHCGRDDSYLKGYACGAAMLLYGERRKPDGIVFPLVQAMRQAAFRDDTIVQLTGEDWPALYSECLSEDCRGGQPPPAGP